MPHPPWEDLSDFFDLDGFGTIAVITRGEATISAEVLGIFDDPNAVSQMGELDHDHAGPRFVCAEADVSAANRGDVVTIEGTAFDLMQQPQLDGTGLATLVLETQTLTYNAAV